jgi:hypothetical protein
MLFKRKFFLDLSGGEAEQKPAVVAPVREATPEPEEEPRTAAPSIAVAAGSAAGAPSAAPAAAPAAEAARAVSDAAPAASSLTTAEAIAAELAAAQAERPAPSLSTFAPECVTAGGAVPMRRRKAGANLAGFKAMAQGMMKS